jgi:hypothetical protein
LIVLVASEQPSRTRHNLVSTRQVADAGESPRSR